MSSDDPANSSIFESDRNVGVFGTVVAIESSPNLSHLGIAEEYKIQGVGEEVKVLLGPGSLIRVSPVHYELATS